jgi:hypothetical protein
MWHCTDRLVRTVYSSHSISSLCTRRGRRPRLSGHRSQFPRMYVYFVLPASLQYSIATGAGVPVTSQRLYSAGTTDDFRQALMYISHRYPKATLHGLGFSLGSNVMTKYMAEEGEQTRLHSGCALACVSIHIHHVFQTSSHIFFVFMLITVKPWDLEANNVR